MFVDVGEVKRPFYLNQPGRITFTYDGNPRGYFNDRNEVHHDVNPSGFRGPAFQPKQPGERHLVFLGDSFTFGEGVRNEDVFPEVAARILRGDTEQVEAYNLGVGGYNTSQSLDLLKRAGLGMQPDAVILDIVLPKKNGFQVCRTLKSDPELKSKVVIVTAKQQDKDRIWGKRLGADYYLAKPVNPNDLIQAISPSCTGNCDRSEIHG